MLQTRIERGTLYKKYLKHVHFALYSGQTSCVVTFQYARFFFQYPEYLGYFSVPWVPVLFFSALSTCVVFQYPEYLGCFSVPWVPRLFFSTLSIWVVFQYPEYLDTLMYVATYLAYGNSAVNPVLYTGLSQTFRAAFRRTLCCCCCYCCRKRRGRNRVQPGLLFQHVVTILSLYRVHVTPA